MIECPWDKETVSEGTTCPRCGRDLSVLLNIWCLPQSLYNQALELWEKDNYEESIRTLRTAMVLAPKFIEGWLLLGKMLARRGGNKKAIECWKKVLDIDYNNEAAQEYLRVARIEKKRPLSRSYLFLITLVIIIGGGAFFLLWRGVNKKIGGIEKNVAQSKEYLEHKILQVEVDLTEAEKTTKDLMSIHKNLVGQFLKIEETLKKSEDKYKALLVEFQKMEKTLKKSGDDYEALVVEFRKMEEEVKRSVASPRDSGKGGEDERREK